MVRPSASTILDSSLDEMAVRYPGQGDHRPQYTQRAPSSRATESMGERHAGAWHVEGTNVGSCNSYPDLEPPCDATSRSRLLSMDLKEVCIDKDRGYAYSLKRSPNVYGGRSMPLRRTSKSTRTCENHFRCVSSDVQTTGENTVR